MTLSQAGSLWATLAFTLGLAAVHMLAPRIYRRLSVAGPAVTSFGGGTAAAYVFLYLLPRLAEGNRAVADLLQHGVKRVRVPSVAAGFLLFLVALVGFFSYYVLERVTHRSQQGRPDAGRVIFGFQLAFFALYSGLVTYPLATKLRVGLLPALLFAVAMGLHIFATDHVLSEHFPARLTARWRLVLVAGTLGGWLVAVFAPPTSTLLVNILTAFLGGGIMLNIFHEELPPARRSSFIWFSIGLAVFGALITIATFATMIGAA
jgi:hypothetical protein